MQLFDYITSGPKAFKAFSKKHKKLKLTGKEFKEIIIAINDEISNYLLEGKAFKFQYGLGEAIIKKSPPSPPKLVDGVWKVNKPIDWKETMKLWEEDPQAKEAKKKIYHLNSHTNGWVASLQWEATKYMPDHKAWKFDSGREFNRKFAKHLLTVEDSMSKFLNIK